MRLLFPLARIFPLSPDLSYFGGKSPFCPRQSGALFPCPALIGGGPGRQGRGYPVHFSLDAPVCLRYPAGRGTKAQGWFLATPFRRCAYPGGARPGVSGWGWLTAMRPPFSPPWIFLLSPDLSYCGGKFPFCPWQSGALFPCPAPIGGGPSPWGLPSPTEKFRPRAAGRKFSGAGGFRCGEPQAAIFPPLGPERARALVPPVAVGAMGGPFPPVPPGG